VLIAGGRSGSDFFQSLLDGHSSICQLPGPFYYDIFWDQIKDIKEVNYISDKFFNDYIYFFDSRKNLIERHNMLGKNKNGFFTVSKKKFTYKFSKLMEGKKINKLNILINLNLAYSFASGENIKKKKLLILHLHHIYRLKFLDNIKYEIIYMIRDPLALISSFFKNWHNYNNNSSWFYYFNIHRVLRGIYEIVEYKKKVHVIQLEKLHLKNFNVMRKFCKISKIKYEKSMKKSSYHGKTWWGDSWSKKYLNGINPKFGNKINEKIFFKHDINFIESYLKDFMINYKYIFRSKLETNSLSKFLPFKMEIKILKRTVRSFDIKNFILIIYYYLRRQFFMRKDKFIYKFPNSIC
jgi:hypothetical protein|tara:strand:- start:893 stop:1945 length:1053 start_codon:yes stop_codon:yes gene_type:complete